jgi:DNA repair ATPase RecN
MECVAADDVKDRLKDVSDDYHDLSSRCSSLGDRLADLSGKHRQFNDAAFKLLDWLTETEGQLADLKHDAHSPEPAQLHAQLDRLKSLSMDALSQRSQLDDMQRKGQDLTNRYQHLCKLHVLVTLSVEDVKQPFPTAQLVACTVHV